MQIKDINAVVTGGASGLGLATATRLVEAGATVTLLDLPSSSGAEQAEALGAAARFVPTDVTDGDAVAAAFTAAAERGPVRAVVHCAGRGRPMRVLTKDGKARRARAVRDGDQAQRDRHLQCAAICGRGYGRERAARRRPRRVRIDRLRRCLRGTDRADQLCDLQSRRRRDDPARCPRSRRRRDQGVHYRTRRLRDAPPTERTRRYP
ncbi:3-hydroxyacyl-CoA dehydrogenase [Rhodococcus opacus PD630]|nr:3-hydroxyacyl-CoA dehydrogenase [Rhodococcus opacus PD630]